MKQLLVTLIACCGTLLGPAAHGQAFLFYNLDAPTRLGSIDGPLAGPGIWAQMLIGKTPDNLAPVWMPLEHRTGGLVGGLVPVYVEGFACLETAYIQMVAWDGQSWGTVLENVPLGQLGRTDIYGQRLGGCLGFPIFAPPFTRPAIVPPIPEPSTAMLGLLVPWPPLLGHELETARRRIGAREWRQRNTAAGVGSTAASFRQEDGGQEHTAFPSRPHLPDPYLPVVGFPQGSVWNRFRLVPLRPKTVRPSRGSNH